MLPSADLTVKGDMSHVGNQGERKERERERERKKKYISITVKKV